MSRRHDLPRVRSASSKEPWNENIRSVSFFALCFVAFAISRLAWFDLGPIASTAFVVCGLFTYYKGTIHGKLLRSMEKMRRTRFFIQTLLLYGILGLYFSIFGAFAIHDKVGAIGPARGGTIVYTYGLPAQIEGVISVWLGLYLLGWTLRLILDH